MLNSEVVRCLSGVSRECIHCHLIFQEGKLFTGQFLIFLCCDKQAGYHFIVLIGYVNPEGVAFSAKGTIEISPLFDVGEC